MIMRRLKNNPMLNQLDIYLRNSDISTLYSDLGIKLHGFIMSKIDTDYAELLHTQEPRPFSLFVYDSGNGFACRVSTLNDEAVQIIDAIANTEKIKVYGIDKPLTVEKISRANPLNAADIPGILSKNKYTADIVTPATRKTSGEYTNPPDLCKYFGSVANKLKVYENISIENSELETLFANIKMSRYIFESKHYMLGGKHIASMTGSFDITINADREQTNKIKLILGYATYCGVGAKTSLGMGGFLVRT